jgi:TonB family protein
MHRFLLVALSCVAIPVAAQSGAVHEVREVDLPPRALNPQALLAALEAGYPAGAVDSAFDGTVRVSLVVDSSGAPREVRVVEPTLPAFDSATVAAVRVLRFTPGYLGRRPVSVRVEFPVAWRFVEGAPEEPTSAAEPELASSPGAEAADSTPAAPPPSAATDTVYEVDMVEVAPRLRNPSVLARALERGYPIVLRDARQSGRVLVRFRVDSRGRVDEARVLTSTDRRFDEPTLDAIRLLRFSPARVAGLPVAVWVVQPIEWYVSP